MLLNTVDLMHIRFDDDTSYYFKPGTFCLLEAGWDTVRDYERVTVPNNEYEAKKAGVAVVQFVIRCFDFDSFCYYCQDGVR